MAFRDERYPELPDDKIVLDFNEKLSRVVLNIYAMLLTKSFKSSSDDKRLAEQITKRIKSIERSELKKKRMDPMEIKRAEWRRINRERKEKKKK